MELQVIQMLCPTNKYSIKCPYQMSPDYITIHNSASDASAKAEISYMISNNKTTSYHLAVDDIQAVQGLPLDRNGWHAGDGNGKGNRDSIGIEICYSKSGGDRFHKAERNAAYLTACLLKERGWGIDRVKKHQDWSGKYCPHRTLDEGWGRFIEMVKAYLNDKPIPTPAPITVDVLYRVKTGGIWLPEVKNLTDYAGINGKPITAFMVRLSDDGKISYRVHLLGKGWLPYVTGYNMGDYAYGFAGDGRTPIDAIEIVSHSHTAKYRVDTVNRNAYYPWQYNNQKNNGQDGYAGVFGKAVDKVQVTLM